MTDYPSDIEIARAATLDPITDVARRLDIPDDALIPYGKTKAKVDVSLLDTLSDRPTGKLVLVTAVSPTPAGEGKTTTTVGLGDALNRVGKRTLICLREPSLGPCFGMKGGAAGGGQSQVVPMEDINLHFTGDFHAISIAHNLLAAMIDNHLHQGNALGIDPRRISWRRVVDMNDRALRQTTIGLGGTGNSIPRETGFDITAASEVMAIFALADSLDDLRTRLGNIRVAETYDRQPVTAKELDADGAMTALLKDALSPNLVQTLEHTPAFVHAGPFGNIAHGCNSVLATRMGLALSDYTVTEAGFGADLGAEKFFDIKCRAAGLRPDAVVLVATIRALKFQAGVAKDQLTTPDTEAVTRGLAHLEAHVENLQRYGVPVVVGINEFVADTDDEIEVVRQAAARLGVEVVRSNHWAHGGAGAEDLAKAVVGLVESGKADFRPLYEDNVSLREKIETIATKIYGAGEVTASNLIWKKLAKFEEQGYGHLPICMAKTQYSFSTDPKAMGRPTGFEVPIRSVELRSGAGFILVLTGSIMTMPGLPKRPAAVDIDVNAEGEIVGLF